MVDGEMPDSSQSRFMMIWRSSGDTSLPKVSREVSRKHET
jgi:hypothetical protein